MQAGDNTNTFFKQSHTDLAVQIRRKNFLSARVWDLQIRFKVLSSVEEEDE